MKKSIIALEGKSNRGKSSVIRSFRERLAFDYPQMRTLKGEFVVQPEHSEHVHDFWEIIEINSLKIGITSQGDLEKYLKEHLDRFLKEECDIIICPARTKGKTRHLILAVEKLDYGLYTLGNLWGGDSTTVSNKELNDLTVDMIMGLFEKLLNGESNVKN